MAYLTDRKRVTGLGSAKSGTHHFWSMTVTSVALLILTPLFLFSFGPLLGERHDLVLEAFGRPYPAIITALMLIVGLHHFRLGVQTLVEDYSKGLTRKALIVITTIFSYALMASGLIALAKIAL